MVLEINVFVIEACVIERRVETRTIEAFKTKARNIDGTVG